MLLHTSGTNAVTFETVWLVAMFMYADRTQVLIVMDSWEMVT